MMLQSDVINKCIARLASKRNKLRIKKRMYILEVVLIPLN